MTITACFLSAAALLSMLLELRVLAVIFIAGAPLGAFVGGYCYRQQVISSGRLPRARWLWLKEDLPPDPPT
jgi:hypothetical protein